jgi:hypothetical protein
LISRLNIKPLSRRDSELRRSVGLKLPQRRFSCPDELPADDDKVPLPLSDVSLRARLMGLRGEVRCLEMGRPGAVLARWLARKVSFALGGKGTARAEGVWWVGALAKGVLPGPLAKMLGWDDARLCGDGDSGDLGDGLGDFLVTRRNFEGDRDRERRRDLTAEVTST